MRRRFTLAVAAISVLSACGGGDSAGALFGDGGDELADDGAVDGGAGGSAGAAADAAAEVTKGEAGAAGSGGDAGSGGKLGTGKDAGGEASAETGGEGGSAGAGGSAGEGGADSDGGAVVEAGGAGGSAGSAGEGGGGTNDSGADVPEACIPDTCAAHGYVCGTLNDRCGHVLVCGPAYVHLPQFDYPYLDTSGGCKASAPHMWACDTAQLKGAAPLSACNSWGADRTYWCCVG